MVGGQLANIVSSSDIDIFSLVGLDGLPATTATAAAAATWSTRLEDGCAAWLSTSTDTRAAAALSFSSFRRLSLTLPLLLMLPLLTLLSDYCLEYHSDTDIESGQTDGLRNLWQSSSFIQTRKAFLSWTDSADSCGRRRGFVSKHDITSTDKLEIKIFISSDVQEIVTLSMQKIRFLRSFFAAVMADLVDLPKTVGARRTCVGGRC